jgi:hypothetical protein
MYPNPSMDGKVTIVYENTGSVTENNAVKIYAMTGAEVFVTAVSSSNGFYNKSLDVSSLQSGIYMVSFQSGDANVTKKLIIK